MRHIITGLLCLMISYTALGQYRARGYTSWLKPQKLDTANGRSYKFEAAHPLVGTTPSQPGQTVTAFSGYLFPWAALNTVDSTLSSYPIGKIPNIEVPARSTYSMYFHSKLANPTYAFKLSRRIDGGLIAFNGFVLYKDTVNAKLQISIPDSLQNPFRITVYGYSNGSAMVADSQTFIVTPAVPLVREDFAAGISTGQAYPQKDDLKYIIISDDTTGSSPRYFNGRLVRPRIVEISGVELTIGQGGLRDASDIYYRYGSDGVINTNIGAMYIYADVVNITSELYLPGTDVYIYARQVTFKQVPGNSNPRIVTSALAPPFQQNVGTIGIPGSRGGNIRIYARDLIGAESGIYFIMNGANGMDGAARSSQFDAIAPGIGGAGGILRSNFDLSQVHVSAQGTIGSPNGGPIQRVPNGSSGYFVYDNRPLAWIHPNYFRMVKKYIDQLYLYGFYDSAAVMTERYAGYILNSELVTGASNDLDQEAETDLGAVIQNYMTTLYQLRANLDYNGNPQGWVPMMSYKATVQTYLTSINPVIEAIYLSQLVKSAYQTNSAKVTAMTKAAASFNAQMMEDTATVTSLRAAMPILDNQIEAHKASIDSLDKAKEKAKDELKERIEKSLKANNKKRLVGGVFKALGAAASLFPGPIAGLASVALNTTGNVFASSQTDIDEEFGIAKGTSITGSYEANEGPGTRYEALEEVSAEASEAPCAPGINFNEEDCRNNKTTNISNKAIRVANAGLNLYSDIKNLKVSEEQIDQVFDKAQATDPKLKAITSQTQRLTQANKQLANTLQADHIKVTRVSQQITNALNAISYLSSGRSATLGRIDMRMMQYMDDLERRALERLQTYHYWMAKSFEYTNCAPFRGDLDVSALFTRIRSMLDTTGNGTLSRSQLNALRTIFTDQVEDNKALILSAYNLNGAPSQATLTFDLDSNQIAQLERGSIGQENAIIYNLLKSSDRLPQTQEDLRIVDITVDTMIIVPRNVRHRFHPNVGFELNIDYPKNGYIRYRGQNYQFYFGDFNNDFSISWGGNYDPFRNQINRNSWDLGNICQTLPAASFIDCNAGTIMTRPAMDANLQIRLQRTGLASDTVPHKIKRLSIKVRYTYRPTNSADMQLVVQPNIEGLKPPFRISRNDKFTRTSGYGYLFRTYTRNTGRVELSTQARYGHYRFVRWKINGVSRPTGQLRVSISTDSQRTVRAVAEFRPLNVKTIVADTVRVPKLLNGQPYYLTIRSGGKDTLETITDSLVAFVSGFSFANTPSHQYLTEGQIDSIAFNVPDFTETGGRELGYVITYSPDDDIFAHKTVFIQGDPIVLRNTIRVQDISLLPNPTTGNVMLKLPSGNQLKQVTVADVTGRVIQVSYQINDPETAFLTTQFLRPGLYFVKLQTADDQVTSVRLVKH